MQVETLADVLSWTSSFHKNLEACMTHCAENQQSERTRMLLQYLADHERKLSTLVMAFEKAAKSSTLKTWCYDYLEKQPIETHQNCDKPFAAMSTDEVIEEAEHQHNQVIDLYRHLESGIDPRDATDLLQQIGDLEEQELKQMVHVANRLQDL